MELESKECFQTRHELMTQTASKTPFSVQTRALEKSIGPLEISSEWAYTLFNHILTDSFLTRLSANYQLKLWLENGVGLKALKLRLVPDRNIREPGNASPVTEAPIHLNTRGAVVRRSAGLLGGKDAI